MWCHFCEIHLQERNFQMYYILKSVLIHTAVG